MTSRERLRAAYRGEPVDRLPWAPLVDATTLRDFPPEVRERGPERFIADLGGDVLVRGCELYRTECKGLEASQHATDDELVVEQRTPVGALREVYRRVASGQWHHVEWPLKSLGDLATYRHIVEHTRYRPAYEGYQRAAEAIGETGIVAPHVQATPVQELVQLGMGVEGFAVGLHEQRREVEALMATMHERDLRLYELVAQSPVEIAILCENTSTGMISPAIYERYSLGHVRDFVEAMHRHGKLAMVHMCGHVRRLLPLIAETGLDGVDCLTPPPTGDTPPHDAWGVIGDHLVIHAACDPTRWLTCPESELERNLLATLDGVRGRRYILCTGADGLAGLPPERFEAVARLVRRHGVPW